MSNLCVAGMSSRCSAEKWEDQKACEFAIKSNKRDCCMHYLDADGRCDNYKAQNNIRKGE